MSVGDFRCARRSGRLRRAAMGSAAAGALALSVLPSPSADGAARSTVVLNVTFGTGSGTVGTPVAGVTGTAKASIRSSVVTANGGAVTLFPSYDGSAIALPSYQELDQKPPLAVIRLADTATSAATDPLNPGVGTFSWSADFSIDNDTGDDASDGDNLFQRGLTPNTLWKVQVDHHVLTCGIKTSSMTDTLYTAGFTIPADQDESSIGTRTAYRVTCTRQATGGGAGTLTASLSRRTSSGSWVAVGPKQSRNGAGGDVSMDPSIPISIGGKLNVAGTGLNDHPDQFNGLTDSLKLMIG